MTNNIETAVILAAGRGSRLKEKTEAVPKCLVKLNGITLLERQIYALKNAGIKRIVVVVGYLAEKISETGVETIFNNNWDNSNMVVSLLTARQLFNEPVIISYSDIVYSSSTIIELISSDAPIAITYDRDWLDLWTKRFEEPLSDAENFVIDNQNRVLEIGGRASSIDKIEGQYMGLLKITPKSMLWIDNVINSKENQNRLKSMDMTMLLSSLLKNNYPIFGLAVHGNWCEIDTPHDLTVAEDLLNNSQLPDIR
jgi:L-glutamine-phosphate cytidylyltransferase